TEQLLDRDDLTDGLEAEGLDERERLVEQDLLTGLERGEVDRGRDGDVHLASRADDVGRARGPRRDELRVAARRLGSLVELLLELDDLLARGVQGRGEPLVLRREQLDLPLEVLELPVAGCLGHAHPPGAVRDVAWFRSSLSRKLARTGSAFGGLAAGPAHLRFRDGRLAEVLGRPGRIRRGVGTLRGAALALGRCDRSE